MNRDIVCCLRLALDSLPPTIRNSKALFHVAKYLYGLPSFLFEFRHRYRQGFCPDLSILYGEKSSYALPRVSESTDINSPHLKLLLKAFHSSDSRYVLDAGCGTGFLLRKLHQIKPTASYIGIDYTAPSPEYHTQGIEYRQGELLKSLNDVPTASVDFSICSHVLEHLQNPKQIIQELRRVTNGTLVLICPLEKEFDWGMNYHINFFPKKSDFLDFIKPGEHPSLNLVENSITRLGDIMYVESR